MQYTTCPRHHCLFSHHRDPLENLDGKPQESPAVSAGLLMDSRRGNDILVAIIPITSKFAIVVTDIRGWTGGQVLAIKKRVPYITYVVTAVSIVIIFGAIGLAVKVVAMQLQVDPNPTYKKLPGFKTDAYNPLASKSTTPSPSASPSKTPSPSPSPSPSASTKATVKKSTSPSPSASVSASPSASPSTDPSPDPSPSTSPDPDPSPSPDPDA